VKTNPDKRILEAALAFAESKPVQWDAFRDKWLQDHPTFTEELAKIQTETLVEQPKPKHYGGNKSTVTEPTAT